MELLVDTIAILVGAACLVLTGWHEWFWWRRSSWIKTSGTVSAIDLQGADMNKHPRITFQHEGKVQEFTSQYGGSTCPEAGECVTVLYDPETLKAEHFTLGNRLLFTLAPLAFGLMFTAIGVVGITPLEEKDAEPEAQRIQQEGLEQIPR
ncbi:DUF3592 domain-containing protein [Verrucomicrobiaceae bacterium 5K15]|uniref:DUF3592 domain-containing protein n=1 Tax=Oceaniferula flava TaxID=2800421 RepID=A0AAE2V8Q0_9BACT|nr:DUF3592 domain-containing protein [Oceaniferula flavus]MBK1853888.1 DUF3592 domain-containing protein [Oceaniferula flavus]MBM1135194.1 DUF3592 domain-containing protein [Oceaniferula flavus]